jgi:hypothetical protein
MDITGVQERRIAQVTAVLRLTLLGHSVVDACKETGIDAATYYRWLKSGLPEIESFRATIQAAQETQLLELLVAQQRGLQDIVKAIEDPDLPIMRKLTLMTYIDDAIAERQKALGVKSTADNAEEYIQLTGPVTSIATGKQLVDPEMSRSHTINIKPQADGSVDLTLFEQSRIIDLLPKSPEHEPDLPDS